MLCLCIPNKYYTIILQKYSDSTLKVLVCIVLKLNVVFISLLTAIKLKFVANFASYIKQRLVYIKINTN